MNKIEDSIWMQRALQLAAYGLGTVQPNPMVGAVLVYQEKIIGEGWHRKYGEHHAEVNAIMSVKDHSLLEKATMYVTLEPCSHYGKTPPCSELICKHNIPRVVIANRDPNEKVNGKGIQQLLDSNIEVQTGVLAKEGIQLNKRFFTYHLLKRPYIILKWAETENGYIDIERDKSPEYYWITNPAAIPQSLLPAIVAIAFAYKSTHFSFLLAILSVCGVVFAHLGSNLLDDYFDAKKNDSSYKDRLASKGIRSRIAKCSYLTDGTATLKQLLFASFCFSIFALILGAVIFYFRVDQIKALFGILFFTIFIGVFYSAWPLRLSYKGLGEFCIALLFGPLLMQGVYIASCGEYSLSLLLISIPIGILVANIVYTHAILDFEPDKMIQKKTLAVVLNNKKWMSFFSFLFLFTPFTIIIVAILLQILPPIFLFVFIPLPLAIWLFISLLHFQKNPSDTPVKKWFHIPMEQWKEVSQAGICWFMIRWYTARNIVILFCVICSLIAIFYPL